MHVTIVSWWGTVIYFRYFHLEAQRLSEAHNSLGYRTRLPCQAAYHGESGLLGQSISEFYYHSN